MNDTELLARLIGINPKSVTEEKEEAIKHAILRHYGVEEPTRWIDVIPSEKEKEELKKKIQKLVNNLEAFVSGAGFEAEVIPVGSVAKDTFLKGSSDIDIFIISKNYREIFNLMKYWKPSGKIKRGELLIWNYQENSHDVDLVFVPPEHPKIDTLKHTEFYDKHLRNNWRCNRRNNQTKRNLQEPMPIHS